MIAFEVGRKYLVWKHQETGEILGISVDFDVPTLCIWALKTKDGWEELHISHDSEPFGWIH